MEIGCDGVSRCVGFPLCLDKMVRAIVAALDMITPGKHPLAWSIEAGGDSFPVYRPSSVLSSCNRTEFCCTSIISASSASLEPTHQYVLGESATSPQEADVQRTAQVRHASLGRRAASCSAYTAVGCDGHSTRRIPSCTSCLAKEYAVPIRCSNHGIIARNAQA